MRTVVVESGVKGKLSTAYVIFNITTIYDDPVLQVILGR
jgi:hypothetical protein